MSSGTASVEAVGRLIDPGIRLGIDHEIEEEIAAAFAFAENSPFPDPGELCTDVYAD